MSVCLCFCVIVFLHLRFSFLATQHCSKAHPVHLGYRSLRQPGASNRISSRFIAAIGNLKSLVTSVNAENWSGLVTLRSSGLTVQDLQPAVQTCVPLQLSAASLPPTSAIFASAIVLLCPTQILLNTHYTPALVHKYAITRRGVCLARNNTVRAAPHPSVCLLVVPIMGAHGCPWVPMGAPD